MGYRTGGGSQAAPQGFSKVGFLSRGGALESGHGAHSLSGGHCHDLRKEKAPAHKGRGFGYCVLFLCPTGIPPQAVRERRGGWPAPPVISRVKMYQV